MYDDVFKDDYDMYDDDIDDFHDDFNDDDIDNDDDEEDDNDDDSLGIVDCVLDHKFHFHQVRM